MPKISVEDRHLTVLNLFATDAADKQERLLGAMQEIVDSAAFAGWISSSMHSGLGRFGTANLIQWRNGEDLEARYAGEEFRHRTLPLFQELTTSIRLLQTEVAFTWRPGLPGGAVEVVPGGDDYTVIEIFKVAEADRDALVEALGEAGQWLEAESGVRSHTVLRGLAARGLEGAFAVSYSQWDGKEAYDAFRGVPQSQQSAARRESQARVEALVTSSDWNSYLPVHSRSAGQ
ncbi:antibiotic biosynthesis monooxygenase [Streptomyces sp. N2-109]|uniref:Antibiotic biosynthesis monooxygenase n=1 Tax=Streptomyces gossypii TaxID=2883101 RepID=A0ABT2JKQ4_9ACTN|nr:antibiotic biosynthesis monooxygenase [Streptomyces gossypii]MCT2588464.1 antibiotic biosynthesis monooxygenase [Streptomyces gossypii]